jgi:hypothetical protein
VDALFYTLHEMEMTAFVTLSVKNFAWANSLAKKDRKERRHIFGPETTGDESRYLKRLLEHCNSKNQNGR